jgi:hypothetical protein
LQQLSWRYLRSGVRKITLRPSSRKRGQHIPEEHEETKFAHQNQVALDMKFTIAILSDWQVTPFSLLAMYKILSKRWRMITSLAESSFRDFSILAAISSTTVLFGCHPRTAQMIISRPRSRRLFP